MTERPIVIFNSWAPYSLDPIEYDAAVHHVTQRPLFASLISQYKAGEFVGVLAESWKISDDEKTWTFSIRNNLRFSNGDPITAEDIRISLTRIAFLMNQKRSLSGLFEKVTGFHQVVSPIEPFPGVEAKPNQLIFHLTEPFPKFLETVSFGLYSLIHPSNFDHATGIWKAGKSAIYSGAYRLIEWSDNTFSIQLRQDFPVELRHKNAFSEFRITTNRDEKTLSDIVVSMDIDIQKPEKSQFFGPVKSGIVYVRLNTYENPHSPFHNIEYRRQARERFYASMLSNGTQATRSFFPLSIPGISELDPSLDLVPFRVNPSVITLMKVKTQANIMQMLPTALKEALSEHKLQIIEKQEENGEKIVFESGRTLDIMAKVTGVLVEDPFEDIRFMILSKEGIKLPDPTGNLRKLVSQKNFEAQEINKQLWNDAIIWPVTHVSDGIFVNPDSIDVSQLNLALPPIDVSWIGKK